MSESKAEMKGSNLKMEPAATGSLEAYLSNVRDRLGSIERTERQAILDEMRNAVMEKASILAEAAGKEEVDLGSMEKALEDFGEPEEVSREYARVATAAPGRDIKLFLLYLVVAPLVMMAIGGLLVQDYFKGIAEGWDPWLPDLLAGAFWMGTSAIIIALAAFQIRRQSTVLDLGPFTALLFLAVGLWGVSMLGWNDDLAWLLPMVGEAWRAPVIAAFGASVVLPVAWGLLCLLRFSEKTRCSTGPGTGPGRGRLRKRSANIVRAGAGVSVAALFVLAFWGVMVPPARPEEWPREGERTFIGSENVDGPFNATIEHFAEYWQGQWWDGYRIVYTCNGSVVNGSFQLELRPALNWLRNNTLEGDVVLSWWDFGHAIRGYAGRESVIYMASKNLVHTIADRNREGRPWESEEKVRAVARVLLAKNASDLKLWAGDFGVRYILTTQRDTQVAYAILQGAGLSTDDHIEMVDGVTFPKQSARDMFIFKVWSGGDFEGTRPVYEDITVKIFELT